MITEIRKLLVSVFGLGYLPVAPGTWGSFGAAAVFVVMAYLLGPSRQPCIWAVACVLTVVAFVVGIYLGPWAAGFYRDKDPSPFVLDEVAGMWVALLAVPLGTTKWLLIVAVTQFLLFRIADIIKPPPARQAEHLPFGWGIMTDDIVAGIYANLVGQVIFRAVWS